MEKIIDYKDEIKSIFSIIHEKASEISSPRSIAELRLDEDITERIRELFNFLPENFDRILEIEDMTFKIDIDQVYSFREMFGILLIAFASERCRDLAFEGMVWPLVHVEFKQSQGSMFPGNHPSFSCKNAIATGVKRLELRNAIGLSGTQEYYDTIKLQCGFTYRGAKKRLPEWLVGLGKPLAVRMLLGEEIANLKSHSFTQLWTTLQRFRRDYIPENQVREILSKSPWIKPNWINDIVKQAKARIEQLGTTSEHSVSTDRPETENTPETITNIKFAEENGKPYIRIEIDLDAIKFLTGGNDTERIRFFFDNEKASFWMRSANGEWSGDEGGRTWLKCETWSPTMFTIESKNKEILENIDLSNTLLHRDVVLFDKNTGEMVDAILHPLDTNRPYILICDDDLTLSIYARSKRDPKCGRSLFYIDAPWSADLKLMLDDSIYWEPALKEKPTQEPVRTIIQTEEPVSIGQTVRLIVSGIPEDVENATILLSEVYSLQKENGVWKTQTPISMTPEIVSGQQRLRIRIQRPNSNRIYLPKRELSVTGLVSYQRLEGENAYCFKLITVNEELNLANNKYLLRVFQPHDKQAALFEGDRLVCRLKENGNINPSDLYGWGERLTLDSTTPLACSVVNKRNVYSFSPGLFGGSAPPRIDLLSEIEPDDDFRIVAWNKGNNKEPFNIYNHSTIQSHNNNSLWRLNIREIGGIVGISYQGYCIGSRWDYDEIKTRLGRHPTAPTFAALRWLKFPVLSSNWNSDIKEQARKNPIDFLRAWWFNQGFSQELTFPNNDPGCDTVIRQFFNDWRATNHHRDQLMDLFCSGDDDANRRDQYTHALIKTSSLCPTILWNIATHINTTKNGGKAVKRALRRLLDLPNETGINAIRRAIERLENEYANLSELERDYIIKLSREFICSLNGQNLEFRCKRDIQRMVEVDIGRTYLSASVLLQLSHF